MSKYPSTGLYEELITAALKSNEDFASSLRSVLEKLDMPLTKFSKISKIPLSTLNKILFEHRDVRLSTLRRIINTVKYIESPMQGNGDYVVGIIAAKRSLEAIKSRVVEVYGKKVKLRFYPVASVEDAIISAILAEREGVHGIVCAEIVGATLERFVRIPISYIHVEEKGFINALSKLITKLEFS